MDWIVRRVIKDDGPSSLRLKAADLLRLAADARHVSFSRKLHEMAERYLNLAQRIEDERADGPPALGDAENPADATSQATERRG
jgi:hypothetical protein